MCGLCFVVVHVEVPGAVLYGTLLFCTLSLNRGGCRGVRIMGIVDKACRAV